MTAPTATPVARPHGRPADGPVHGHVGVIAVVAEPWGGMWLSRQQILTRLSRWFHVAWVDPPLGWRRLWFGGARKAVGQRDDKMAPWPGFRVERQDPWLPKLFRPKGLARRVEALRLARARRSLARRGCRRFVLYVWQPKFAGALDLVEHDVSCYHIADEYSFSDVETPISARELRLIESADQVIVHSPALREKKGGINPNTAFITNGVDYDAFARQYEEPDDLAAVPRPRIGYIGRVKVQLDWGVLEGLARRRPDWSFVFVGPMGFLGEAAGAQRAVFARENVHYLGPKPVEQVPAYTNHMDVCILAYRRNNYTKYIFPLKLHEYLAAGKPVVGSDIRSLQDFEGVIGIARSEDEWEAMISAGLVPEAMSQERVDERRSTAREYDWDVLVERIAQTLRDRLGRAPGTPGR